MTTRILAFAVSALFTLPAFASNDRQAEAAKELPQTVIVRVSNETGEASMLESSQLLKNSDVEIAAVHGNGGFKPVSKGVSGTSELDRESGTASWYVYYPQHSYYYAPTYYYYGRSYGYTSYCNYSYYGYSYYWYYRGW